MKTSHVAYRNPHSLLPDRPPRYRPPTQTQTWTCTARPILIQRRKQTKYLRGYICSRAGYFLPRPSANFESDSTDPRSALAMGVVTASRIPLGFAGSWPPRRRHHHHHHHHQQQQLSLLRRPLVLAFKTAGKSNSPFLKSQEPIPMAAVELGKEQDTIPTTTTTTKKKKKKQVKAACVDEAPSCSSDMDYDAVAATLESIYTLSPGDLYHRRKGAGDLATTVAVSSTKKLTRLNLARRISSLKRKNQGGTADGDNVAASDLHGIDWKKTKIPSVLPTSEHTRLFMLLQPMKASLAVKERLRRVLLREPTEQELAAATNMPVSEMRRTLQLAMAARNKLIKHNLRLVLFVINKYYHDLATGSNFQELCQAGVKGLMEAIDRFEPNRGYRLSTYGLFWVRHAIARSITASSFTRIPFAFESARREIRRAKWDLTFELQRAPSDAEIIAKLGLSATRYSDVVRSSRSVLSLNAKHAVTQEEFIDTVSYEDGVGGDKNRRSALLRLALDDVLDSLKPKESMVIRQRYGLDGKGDRTLGEIGGNLNISREMVRKYELKALMKLKHPARLDYLRRHMT